MLLSLKPGFKRLLLITFTSLLSTALVIYFTGITAKERNLINNKIITAINRLK